MSNRVRFIPNQQSGAHVLLIDLSDFAHPIDSLPHIAAARELVGDQPHKSVCCIVDISGSPYNVEVIDRLNELAIHNRPFVVASAVVGVTGFKRLIMESVMRLAGRSNLKAVPTREAAFEWLATQIPPHQTATSALT
ncbi:MAG: hypothetical protein ABI311_14005 [Gemmatimonadaceae bacterium]